MAKHDVPVIVNYVRRKAAGPVAWIGHSQGTTQFFAAAARSQFDSSAVCLCSAVAPVTRIDVKRFGSFLGSLLLSLGDLVLERYPHPTLPNLHSTWGNNLILRDQAVFADWLEATFMQRFGLADAAASYRGRTNIQNLKAWARLVRISLFVCLFACLLFSLLVCLFFYFSVVFRLYSVYNHIEGFELYFANKANEQLERTYPCVILLVLPVFLFSFPRLFPTLALALWLCVFGFFSSLSLLMLRFVQEILAIQLEWSTICDVSKFL